jgi:hypothetical protein
VKKILLTAGITVLAIILIGGILIFANKKQLTNLAIEKSFGVMENIVLGNLPQSIRQDSAKTIFTKAVVKIKKGEANQAELQQVVLNFQTSFGDNKLDSLEALHLLKGINQLADAVAEK